MGLSHYRDRTGFTRPPCDRPDDCEFCQAMMIPSQAACVAAVDDLFARCLRGEPVIIGVHTYTGMYRNSDSAR